MSPQALLRARFAELADLLNIELLARRQSGKFHFTVRGEWRDTQRFIDTAFPQAWVTSAAGPETTHGLPLKEVARVLAGLHVEPTWLEHNNAVVRRLAQTVREDRAFDVLPLLADALEEAGCTHAEMLEHCRAALRHRNTCWVIELLLGSDRRRRPTENG